MRLRETLPKARGTIKKPLILRNIAPFGPNTAETENKKRDEKSLPPPASNHPVNCDRMLPPIFAILPDA